METLVATSESDWRAVMPLWAHMQLWRFREWYPKATTFELGEIESAAMVDPCQCIVHIAVLNEPLVRVAVKVFHKGQEAR